MLRCSLFLMTRKTVKHIIEHHRNCSTDKAVSLSFASYQSTNTVPEGPPLLIIHGLFGSKKNWESLSKAFGQVRKVVTVDCRNHGESPHTPDMDYLLMAADVERLMTELKMGEAVLLGHSMGGKVAMALALTKPHLVSKLIVEDVSPTVSGTAISTFPTYLEGMGGVKFDESLSLPAMRRSAHEQLKSFIPEKPTRDFIVTNIVQNDSDYGWRINIDAIANNLEVLASFPDLQLTYDKPTLFIGGEKSTHITEKHRPEILRFFPSAVIRHIEGAGHWLHAEKPRELLKMVLDFIK